MGLMSDAPLSGMLTNFSLMMLSQAVRDLVEARRKQRRKGGKLNFFFRKYLFDLILLLQESMTGSALTAIFVCLSQAPANAQASKFSLEFGEVFTQLEIKKKPMPKESRSKLAKRAVELLAESEEALGVGGKKRQQDRFTAMRQAQARDCRYMLEALAQFGPAGGGGGDGPGCSAKGCEASAKYE
jgi:hypothetical protein